MGRLHVAVYRLATDAPEADGTLAWNSTTAVVVHAWAGEVAGVGWTSADATAASVVLGLLAETVVGRPALEVSAHCVPNLHAHPALATPNLRAADVEELRVA